MSAWLQNYILRDLVLLYKCKQTVFDYIEEFVKFPFCVKSIEYFIFEYM